MVSLATLDLNSPIAKVADPNQHYFGKPDPDWHKGEIQKL
jgi:hypothetical protein